MNIKIKIIDKNKVAVKLSAIAYGLKNPRPLWARWGVQALKWVDDNFRRQGGLLKEGKWDKLKPSTLRGKRRRKRRPTKSTKILMDSGDLRKSFSTRFSRIGVYIGTKKEFAIYHDSDRPRKKLPQRRMLPRQKDDSIIKILKKTTRNYLRQKGKGIFK